NGYVKLNNRKLTSNEISAVYEAIHQLSIDIFENQDAQSEKSKRLINWLRSVIYWGTPKNKVAGNSIWFSTINGEFSLSIVDKIYPFIPSSIEENKDEIITILEGMYNNVNSGLTDKPELWNTPYEEILAISPEGLIESKQWQNYQTFLLSQEGRRKEDLPLFTQLKPVKEGETNRQGIYFTITDTVDRFNAVPTIQKKSLFTEKEVPKEQYILDGKNVNTYIAASGSKVDFTASSLNDIKILPSEGVDKVMNNLPSGMTKEKVNEAFVNIIKNAIIPQLTPTPKTKSLFDKPTDQKPALISVSKEEDLDEMSWNVDDLEEEVPLRKKLSETLKHFEGEDWNKTQEWIKQNFPNIPVYRVKNIIQATNGIQAWGMLKDGAIYVYENAEIGTVYHEVFEAVWKMFSSPEEELSIINEF